MMEKAGFNTISCNPIGDRGNLWGVFQAVMNNDLRNFTKPSSSDLNWKQIHQVKALYYLRVWNFFKFLPKLIKQINEKIKSNGLKGKEILNMLYF